MTLALGDFATLACPVCHARLERVGTRSGALSCRACGRSWSVVNGIPLLCDFETSGIDRLLRPIYDFVAPYHDLGAELVLPLLQYPDAADRARYVEHLDLDSLRPHPDGSPLRILEVGIGTGANVPLVTRELRQGLDVEFWGVDFSPVMLCIAARHWGDSGAHRVRLVLADALALPFADGTFDRVFHVGGINAYRDVRRGLAEMARVARPGTSVVVVDEELDPNGSHSLFHRLAFATITAFDAIARAPRELVPIGAHDVTVDRVSRFYYCMTFRLGSENGAAPPVTTTARNVALQRSTSTMPIDTILTASQLSNLRDAYNPAKMNAALGVTLPAIYPGSQPYMDALGDLFYGGANADLSKSPLSARGRERCLIALLASQGARLNLAVHVYMALMEGVEPNEIAHVLMLVGAYSGVSYFADSLKVAEKTLTELKAVADSGNSGAVDALIALVKAFPT